MCFTFFSGENECYVVKAVREVSFYSIFVLFTCFYGQRSFDTGFTARLMELVGIECLTCLRFLVDYFFFYQNQAEKI